MVAKQEGSDVKKTASPKGPGIRTFNVYIGDEHYEVDVEETSAASAARPVVSTPPAVAQPAASTAPASTPAPTPAPAATPAPAPAAPAAVGKGEAVVSAPMPGTVLSYEVRVGDAIKKGDIVVMLEAMKMENAIPSPADGVIKTINASSGDSLKKGDVLAVISTG